MKKILMSFLSIILIFSFMFSFLSFFVVAKENQYGVINKDSVRVRTSPSTKQDNKYEYNGKVINLNTGDSVSILEIVKSPDDNDYPNWCHINFQYDNKTLEGYVASEFVDIRPIASEDVSINKIYKKQIEELKAKHPNWNFVVYDTGYEWNSLFSEKLEGKLGTSLIPYSYPISYRSTQKGCYDYRNDKWVALDSGQWYQANSQTIAYYMDPRNFLNEDNVFMFETLSYIPKYHTINGVKSIISGSFMDNKQIKKDDNFISYEQAYMDAAYIANVSPFHLASRTIQEVGKKGSASVLEEMRDYNGIHKGYEGIFNFYNIGATQGNNPILNGLNYAKNGGGLDKQYKEKYMIPWDSQYKAIVGGAKWIGSGYINSSHKQDTLYFQKFNTSNESPEYMYHQYMGNLAAPLNESAKVRESYKKIGIIDNSFTFRIPYYHNMPKEISQLPPKNNNCNPNNWLKSITVNGNRLDGFDGGTESGYNFYVPVNTTSVTVNATPYNGDAKISGTGKYNLKDKNTSIALSVKAQNGEVKKYSFNIIKSDNAEINLQSINLNKNSLSMFVNDSYQLSVSYNPSYTTDDKTVVWSSSNNNVVKVNNGKITAVGEGSATITAKVGRFTASCNVNVSGKFMVGDVDADNSITLTDALLIFKYKSGVINLSQTAKKAADTDRDGEVTNADALRIFKYKSSEIPNL